MGFKDRFICFIIFSPFFPLYGRIRRLIVGVVSEFCSLSGGVLLGGSWGGDGGDNGGGVAEKSDLTELKTCVMT